MKEINDDFVFNNDDSTLPGFDPDSITSLPGMNEEESFEMPGINNTSNEQINNVQPDINVQNGVANEQVPQFDPYADMMNQNFGYQNQDNGYQNQDFNMMNQNNQYQNEQYQSNDSDDGFMQAWMGSLYEKARVKKFNWCAAFFGPVYMLFRKMFTTGLLMLILQMALVVVAQLVMKASTIAGIIMNVALPVMYFITFGFVFYPLYNGFVKGQEEKYSKLVKNPNQLNAIASKKGGTSPLGIVLAVVLYSVFSTVLMFSGLVKTPELSKNEVKTNNIINNVVEETTEEYNFDDKYAFKYDSSKWFLDEDKKQIKNGDYTLEYKGKYTAQALKMDMSSLEGLNKLLNILQTSFTSQAAQNNFQVEKGSNNFIKQNDNYYAYLDIIDSTSISRYYFVVIPNDGVLFQFVLTTEDTTINYQFNVDVIDMITNIVNVDEEDAENTNTNVVNQNELTNTTSSVLSNDVTGNTVNTNSTNNTNVTNTTNGSNTTSMTNTVSNDNSNTTNTTNTTRVLTTTNSTQNRNLNSFLN